MPKPATIKTIRDLEGAAGASSSSVGSNRVVGKPKFHGSDYKITGNSDPPTLYHISTLNNDNIAKTLLERVVAEFLPILRRRGYNVRTISEMCCCSDGLDSICRRKGGRRMGNNVWGYNQTITGRGRKYHEIHVRLRQPTAHNECFLPYEDVAGTLAHELAHCERGPHDKQFFSIMESILDEHAELLASGITRGAVIADTSFMGSGQRLGGRCTDRKRSRLLQNAGSKLGRDKATQSQMSLAEAAAAAAEMRKRQLRLKGVHCCRPCVIEIDDDEEEEEEENIDDQLVGSIDGKRETGSSTQTVKRQRVEVIDLTDDTCRPSNSKGPEIQRYQNWTCKACTFLNSSFLTSCEVCESPRT